MSQFQQEFITTAIEHYGLELEDDYRSETLSQRVDFIVVTWFQNYDPAWVVKALIESLYRGRYKVKSVDNILRDWQRRGSPFYKFTPDYEREILHSLRLTIDNPITSIPSALPAPVSNPERELPVSTSQLPNSEQLNPEESAPFQHHDRSISVARSTSDRDANLSAELEQTMLVSAASADTLDRAISLIPSVPEQSTDRASIEIDRSTPSGKLYLFNKLRAIVEPSCCQDEGIQHSV
jgi:hypothetical protein